LQEVKFKEKQTINTSKKLVLINLYIFNSTEIYSLYFNKKKRAYTK
jgi:hypothetical protein